MWKTQKIRTVGPASRGSSPGVTTRFQPCGLSWCVSKSLWGDIRVWNFVRHFAQCDLPGCPSRNLRMESAWGSSIRIISGRRCSSSRSECGENHTPR